MKYDTIFMGVYMISEKYKNIYKQFVENYKKIHVNPWHEIDEKQLHKIYDKLTESMNVDSYYNFCYFINYIIKHLSGKEDAHTSCVCFNPISLSFRVFGDEVFVDSLQNKHDKLLSVSGVDVKTILSQLDEILTYGTEGRRRCQLELALLDKSLMFGLPCFRECDTLSYQLLKPDGEKIITTFDRSLTVSQGDLDNYYSILYGSVASYRKIDNALIYCHRSVQPRFAEKIKGTIQKLKQEDLSQIDTIIVDLRGNTGGNAALNEPLLEFLRENSDKKLYCLTDYRIFSGGRYALRDLISLGATTIGEEISTPINCYGNSHHVLIDGLPFSISEAYFHPFKNIEVYSKEDFAKLSKEILKPLIFHPDIEVVPTKKDFLNDEDVVLKKALELSQQQKHKEV